MLFTKMNGQVSLLKNFINFNYFPVRSCKKFSGGIEYPGFTYYPRTENFQDPPYEPSKLFLVTRCKPIKGTNHEEKKVLGLLNVDGDKKYNGHINVVKNIPRINALLWKVKHLIVIKPITWKGELPKEGDYSGTFLRQTGELVISPKLKLTSDMLETTEKFLYNPNKLSRRYFKEYLKEKWLNGFSGDI